MLNLRKVTKKKCIRLLCLMLFFILFSSCLNTDQQFFDLSLIKKSRELVISGDYSTYLALQRNQLEIALQKGDKERQALSYIQVARLNSLTNKYDVALKLLNKADSLLNDSRSNLYHIILYDTYTELYKYIKMYDLGIQYSDKALSLLNRIPRQDVKSYFDFLLNFRRGDLLVRKSEMDSALVYLHKGFKSVPLEDPKEEINANCVLAEFHIANKRLDSSKFYLDRTLGILNKNQFIESGANRYNYFHFYFIQGEYYIQTNEYIKAEDSYQKAEQIGANWNNGTGFYMSYLYLAMNNFYKFTGKQDQSEFYQKKNKLETEKLNTYIDKTVYPAVNKFVSDINREEENEQNEVILIRILAVISIIIGIFVFVYLINLKNKKRKLLKKEISDLKQELNDENYLQILLLAKNNDERFLSQFDELYPDFVTKLHWINPELGTAELTFCAFLKLHFTTKEIAIYTNVLPKSVQQRKRRLRKKLCIPSDVDMYTFFQEL